MRTYSGFILFEDILDYLPTTNTSLYSFANNITHPSVTIVSEDCLTTNGYMATITYELEGRIELATGVPITETRILYLVSQGIYKIGVRSLDTCISPNGVCRACYKGTFLDSTPPPVGTVTKIVPEYNFSTDVIRGNGGTTVFTLSQLPATYEKVLVIQNGNIMSSGYTITNDQLTLTVAPSLGINVIVKYYNITSQPYVGYLANTYSGSLLGMKALPTQAIHIRPSLINSLLGDTEMNLAKDELGSHYKMITPLYLDYIDRVPDKLEKSLYMSVLYGIYSNVSS